MPPTLEKLANVVLRVPSIVLLDLLYRWDVQAFAELLNPRSPDAHLRKHLLWNLYYAGHVVCMVVLLLPVRSLVKLYLYILTVLLLYVSHQTARDYIRHEMERDFHGAVYSDPVALSCFATALTSQVIVATLCALLLQTRRVWLFCGPLLPLAARLCGFPLQALTTVNTFAALLTATEAVYVATTCLSVPFHLAAAACREITQVLEVYRLVSLGMSLWRQLAVPLLFLVFWLTLFILQILALASSSSGNLLSQQGILFIFLSSVAECCSTPYSLIGLTFTISYLALGLLRLCKFYLAGYGAFQNGNVMHRGVTEGVTLLLLAIQTDLLDLQLLHRTFLLSIILFIVVTSTLQSMIEITDPVVLGLGASRNRSVWKHFRAVSMCLFLLIFPGYMAYKIAHFFHMDFWLLILVSSCMLTSLQVMGTLFIYVLFMIELFQDSPMEKMDEIIYYVNAISRVLEFLVAVCVVAYGTWESIFGEWSWMGASVIIIHCYFNVWLRAQLGWKSFLLRREAAKKISSLPEATRTQLENHNDVCAICFQEMGVAVVMQCSHLFHGNCLRKWFYVQDTCPLCHQPVVPVAGQEDRPPQGGAQATEPAPGREEAPSPGSGGGPPADHGAEGTGDGRSAEDSDSSRGDPQPAGPSGKEPYPFGGLGESLERGPGHEAREASFTAAESGRGPDRPALESTVERQAGDPWAGSEEPRSLGQNPPGSRFLQRESAGPGSQAESNSPLPTAMGGLSGDRLEGRAASPSPVDPPVVAEGKEERTRAAHWHQGASLHLESSVRSGEKPEDCPDSCTSFS